MSSKKPEDTKKQTGNSSDELTTVVEELLNSLSSKFDGVSSEIFAKMDDMARRLDHLEASLQANDENGANSSPRT
ncbi:heat shock factor binding protein 1-domain-containing protein [Daldinia loculata]|uniref:heat shock factor binding protein 1-domain-containing protein n=1 Tax=Daldinia loculata TaxID=103429 RepID=UPI0020C3F586|nr:heat shock factor binding protein 1-domain-containing protein [Daldinia loculata]KAI1645586.1 heat shock factor binding protein 1-domain-containing protein [Daldinia loculata]